MIILNVTLVLCAMFFIFLGVIEIVRFKSKAIYFCFTMLAIAFCSIGVIRTDNIKTYYEPAAMMVQDGTLVVIDLNKNVYTVNDYQSGLVCIEKTVYKTLVPLFSDSSYNVNTKCQNLLK